MVEATNTAQPQAQPAAPAKEMTLKTGTPLDAIASATGMTIPQLTRYAMYAGVACVMLGIGGTYITVAIGVAYPVFMSFLALESEGSDDDKQWLTYWVVFGLLNLVDQFSGFVLSLIPFYFFLKLCFLIFLMHPSTMGALMVYDTYILPLMSKAEVHIQKAEQLVQEKAGEAYDAARKKMS